MHHHPSRLRIHPHIEFRCRSDVALATGSATHHHATAHLKRNLRFLRESERHVRQWAEYNHDEPRVRLNRFDDRIDRVQLPWNSPRSRIAVVPEPIAPVEPHRVLIAAQQWFLRARVDGNIGSTKFDRVERVPRGLLDIHISRDGCDRDHADIGRA